MENLVWGLILKTRKMGFQSLFQNVLEKQPIERSKQPIVTCFYCMKRGHSVRFCKIRKYYVPNGILKWVPKGCEVSNDKAESKGPTFVRGPNLVA